MLYSFLNINVEHPPRKNGLKLVFENTLLRDVRYLRNLQFYLLLNIIIFLYLLCYSAWSCSTCFYHNCFLTHHCILHVEWSSPIIKEQHSTCMRCFFLGGGFALLGNTHAVFSGSVRWLHKIRYEICFCRSWWWGSPSCKTLHIILVCWVWNVIQYL